MELDGKVVLVTGGANGIGRALCERFGREGASGIAVVDLDGDRAQEVASGIGARAIGLRADVSDDADVRAAVEATEDGLGPIDLLVCNAGIGSMAGVDADDEVWQRVWDVNVMAHVRAVRAVLPGMLARGSGYVLTTASAAGLLTNLGDAPYSVTKHAAVALAEWLAITHGDDGLRVSCLCPQGVDTDLLRSATGGTSGDVVVAQGVISPEAVADAVVEGLRDERFLILPHPEVAGYVQRKAADHDRWIAGMRKLQRGLRGT